MSWFAHLVLTLASVAWLSQGQPEMVAAVLPSADAARPPLVVVRALGPVPSERLRGTCRLLLAEFPVRCVVRANRSATEVLDAWDPQREQLDGRRTLDILFDTRSHDAVVELDVTAFDLFEEGKPYVFGLASLPDRTALISSARLALDSASAHDPTVAPTVAEAEVVDQRFATLVRHEIGHALGLAHHDVTECVMRQDPTVWSLDTAPTGACEVCRGRMTASIEELSRPGQIALDRSRGLLVRGRTEEARAVVVDALWRYHPDVELVDSFARVFFEAGQYNEAISLLRHTLARDPERATAYVQLGLAYQRRGRSGDLGRAVVHFEDAVALRPDWEAVVALLEATRAEQQAQGPG